MLVTLPFVAFIPSFFLVVLFFSPTCKPSTTLMTTLLLVPRHHHHTFLPFRSFNLLPHFFFGHVSQTKPLTYIHTPIITPAPPSFLKRFPFTSIGRSVFVISFVYYAVQGISFFRAIYFAFAFPSLIQFLHHLTEACLDWT